MSDVVKYFHSGMAGAPQMGNTLGQMISVLDGCLISGFNSLTPSSITRSGSTATVTFGTAHGYEVDQVLLVSGADQTAYNGEMRILSVPTLTTLTFAVIGTPTTPATSGSTLNTKAAPLDFVKIFSATNKAMYQSQNVTTNQWILRLDGTAWTGYTTGKGVYYKVDICRTASDIDTMTESTTATANAAASFGRYRWFQANTTGAPTATTASTNRAWALYGNDKCFYFTVGAIEYSDLSFMSIYGFGDFDSYRVGDAYNTALFATDYSAGGVAATIPTPSELGWDAIVNKTTAGMYVAKNHLGLGQLQAATPLTFGNLSASAGYLSGGALSPLSVVNPQDYSLFFNPIVYVESSGIRGVIKGIYSIPHVLGANYNNLQGQKYSQTIGSVTKTFRMCKVVGNSANGQSGQVGYLGFDITGPW